jgi:hypothetical protein
VDGWHLWRDTPPGERYLLRLIAHVVKFAIEMLSEIETAAGNGKFAKVAKLLADTGHSRDVPLSREYASKHFPCESQGRLNLDSVRVTG